jgi:hypothetical protein
MDSIASLTLKNFVKILTKLKSKHCMIRIIKACKLFLTVFFLGYQRVIITDYKLLFFLFDIYILIKSVKLVESFPLNGLKTGWNFTLQNYIHRNSRLTLDIFVMILELPKLKKLQQVFANFISLHLVFL